MSPFFLSPGPVPVYGREAAEMGEAGFDDVATCFRDNGDDVLELIPGLENLPCKSRPATSRDRLQTFQTARNYTDTVTLRGYHEIKRPRMVVMVVRPHGERQYFNVLDLNYEGDTNYTILYCSRREVNS